MQLDILTPEKRLFSGDVESVTFPGALGIFTVLPNHAPIISSLCPHGEVSYTQGNRTETILIGGGFVQVKKNQITLCADSQEKAPETSTS
jgi:F-type H+-transporting ATPase subunit epsilon